MRPSPPEPLRHPLDPARVRTLPGHFAWVDHRLRERLRALSLEEIAVLFFLHLAADKHGLSFWADATIARKLRLGEGDVVQARFRLVAKGLVAYRYPLYQLLPLADNRP
jgi:DNA-binding MarR family transcriptional regulator